MTSPLQQQKEMLGHLIIVCRTSTESIFQMVRFYFCVRLSRPSARKCKRKLLFSHASVCDIRTKKTKKKKSKPYHQDGDCDGDADPAVPRAAAADPTVAGPAAVDPPAASRSCLSLPSLSSRGSQGDCCRPSPLPPSEREERR